MARSGMPILITGESGTGKELIARGIHRCGPHPDNPFVPVNVASVPESLFESQFFGHVRGAFTGAEKAMPGYFEQADGGTLFLDEIGELPFHLQAKLLRALEEKTVVRIGDSRAVSINVRIVSATNQNLDKACRDGKFRLDLLYRLKSAHIHLPPLRERKADIPLLIGHFLDQLNQKKRTQVTGISEKTMELMVAHSWPGNVRELRNMMERLVVLTQEGEIYPRDLPQKLRTVAEEDVTAVPEMEVSGDGICLSTAVSDFEKSLISQSMKKANGVKKNAAKLLNIKRTTLIEKIKRHNLEENFA